MTSKEIKADGKIRYAGLINPDEHTPPYEVIGNIYENPELLNGSRSEATGAADK